MPSPLLRLLAALLALVLLPLQAAHAQFGGPAVTTRIVPERISVRPGDQIAVAVVLDHAEGYHTWPADVVALPADIAEFAIRTKIELPKPPQWIARFDGIQWPQAKPDRVANPSGGDPVEVPLYSHAAVAFIRILVSPDAQPGPATLSVTVSYQACDESMCQMPQEDTLSTTLTIAASPDAAAAAPNEPDLFTTYDVSQWGKSQAVAGPAANKVVKFNVFGWAFSIDTAGPVGLGLLLLAAMLGGLLLNVTPCVLPVIPIKILGLSQAAGNPARCLFLGVIMSLGVVSFWLGIGAAMAFISGFKSISTLFQNPWFPLAVGVFMLVMGAGMLNAYAVRLPNWLYMINPRHDTVHGSFGFGVMTAVLSTPCTAPFMGAAAAWAAFQPASITLLTFAAIGVGMALPYLLLAANPKWVARVPRTGPGSELVKQVMGLLMFAVAAFFIGLPVAGWLNNPPDPVSRAYWWLVAIFAVAAFLWLAWRTWRITRSPLKRAVFSGGGLVAAVGTLLLASSLASHGPIDWRYYTPDRFRTAISEGNVVVLDFTAEWCLNCKALESGVLHRPQIVELLNKGDRIVPMKVDITGDNPDGRAKLKELQWVGIPLLAIYGPGLPDPIKFDSYTPDMVVQAIEQARATRTQVGSASPALSPR